MHVFIRRSIQIFFFSFSLGDESWCAFAGMTTFVNDRLSTAFEVNLNWLTNSLDGGF